MNQDSLLNHVSDTALWVAHYRAEESNRADALFHDPYAQALAGDKGRKIAESMRETSRYTAWSLTIRTRLIDEFIQNLLADGVDTVLNLGAGLDSRPYRLDLPENLQWIEVDYPHMIDYKTRILEAEKPHCRLQRMPLDLADREKRRTLFAEIASSAKKILVLTEGVIPYLTETQVAELAEDLHAHPSIRFWIAEYFSPDVYRYFKSPKQVRRMGNTPFRFFPDDWFGLFLNRGWVPREVRYMAAESQKLKRTMPIPWWARILGLLAGRKKKEIFNRMSGYVIFEPRP